MENNDKHFMSHPELNSFINETFNILIGESDRGAVLLGVSTIDTYLTMYFEQLVPECVSNKKRNEIFNYNGPFGSISSKLDVALVCRLLPYNLIDAIHKIRKIRNDLAHKIFEFSLNNYEEVFYEIYSFLGEGLDVGVNQIVREMMLENLILKLLDVDNPINKQEILFKNTEDVIDYLFNNSEVLQGLEVNRHRYELSVAIWIICSLILLHKDLKISKFDNI